VEQDKPKITKEMRESLREPFPSEAISPHPTKSFLSTLKAIYVVERLNDVFGVGRWDLKTNVVEKTDNYVLMKGKLEIHDYSVIVPEQYGGHKTADKNTEMADGYKSAVTDVLSKTASYLEVGIDVFKGKANGKKPTKNKPTEKGLTSSSGSNNQSNNFEFATEKQITAVSAILTKNMINRDDFKMYLSDRKQIGEDNGRLTMKKLNFKFASQILDRPDDAMEGFRKWRSEKEKETDRTPF